jgi:hypothetical protein
MLAIFATPEASAAGYQQDASTGLVSIELENFDTNLPQGNHAWSTIASGDASGGTTTPASRPPARGSITG